MSKPVVIETRGMIAASPEVIWPYLVDWERLGRWMKEAIDFRVVSKHREGVGVIAVATIRIAGIRTSDFIRTARWEPPHVLELEHLGWVKGRGFMQAKPSESGTDFYWKETLVPPWGILGAIGMRAWRPLMRRTFAEDLLLLKRLVESESGR